MYIYTLKIKRNIHEAQWLNGNIGSVKPTKTRSERASKNIMDKKACCSLVSPESGTHCLCISIVNCTVCIGKATTIPEPKKRKTT